jgi:hypothetical protein
MAASSLDVSYVDLPFGLRRYDRHRLIKRRRKDFDSGTDCGKNFF